MFQFRPGVGSPARQVDAVGLLRHDPFKFEVAAGLHRLVDGSFDRETWMCLPSVTSSLSRSRRSTYVDFGGNRRRAIRRRPSDALGCARVLGRCRALESGPSALQTPRSQDGCPAQRHDLTVEDAIDVHARGELDEFGVGLRHVVAVAAGQRDGPGRIVHAGTHGGERADVVHFISNAQSSVCRRTASMSPMLANIGARSVGSARTWCSEFSGADERAASPRRTFG